MFLDKLYAAISQSGTALATWAIPSQTLKMSATLAKRLHCRHWHSLLHCLQHLPAKKLVGEQMYLFVS